MEMSLLNTENIFFFSINIMLAKQVISSSYSFKSLCSGKEADSFAL